MIQVSNCTLQYPSKKGIQDVSFQIDKGKIFGYLGPNGAGKTTTIRALMGFMKPQQGSCMINGMDCWSKRHVIQKDVGYLPGEIAFFDDMTGIEFLKFQLQLKNIHDETMMKDLLDLFELDPKTMIRKMSKGMKQKIGIVCAFMSDPDVFILDEPTSGLDPLMQQVVWELLLKKKHEGKTILMSSHSFDEVEKTCDEVAMIKEGKIAVIEDIDVLKKQRRKVFELTVKDHIDINKMKTLFEHVKVINDKTFEVEVIGDFHLFFQKVKEIDLIDLDVKTQRLEQVFMQYYGKDNNHEYNTI